GGQELFVEEARSYGDVVIAVRRLGPLAERPAGLSREPRGVGISEERVRSLRFAGTRGGDPMSRYGDGIHAALRKGGASEPAVAVRAFSSFSSLRNQKPKAPHCLKMRAVPTGSAASAASTPPIMAPMTPTVATSLPLKKRF